MAENMEIAAALAAAQGAMNSVTRNRTVQVKMKTGGSYTFRYATLDQINDMIRRPLAENGLSLVQLIEQNDQGRMQLRTRLLHSSGEHLDTVLPLKASPDDPQAFGSAITYFRRYAISALLNVASDEDDDGNAAAGRQAVTKRDKDGSEHIVVDRQRPEPTQDRRGAPAGAQVPTEGVSTQEEDILKAIARMVSRLEGPEDVADLLLYWNRQWHAIKRLREREDVVAFIEGQIGGALHRVHRTAAIAFKMALRARTRAHLAIIDERILGVWASDLAALRFDMPVMYDHLSAHIMAQQACVEKLDPTPVAADPDEDPRKAAPVPNEYVLKDEYGEAASTPFADASKFVRRFVEKWVATSLAGRSNLAEHNADDLLAAIATPAARTLLSEACPEALEVLEPGEVRQEAPDAPDLYVTPPRGQDGKIQVAGFLRAGLDALERLDPRHAGAWVDANKDAMGELPPSSRQRLADKVTMIQRGGQ